MAITSYENVFDNNIAKTSCSKSSNLNTLSSMKIDYTMNTSLTSCNSQYNKPKTEKYISPYLSDDRIRRVTEKRFLHKNNDSMPSYSLAVNIYKANSDDLRSSKRCSKKVKKSVLTLPNEPAPLPQACTVSDMNDSEYFNDDKYNTIPKPKKKRVIQTKRKSRVRNRQNDFYDTNANYWQLDDLDDGSKEVVSFTGSIKNKSEKSQKDKLNVKSHFNAHNVWSLLRNVNQFKFRPSPPVSQESSVLSIKNNKRRKNKIKRPNRKNTRLIETCRTEEFAYISSFVDSSRNSCSQSSFDRITVIEKQDEIKTIKCNKVGNEFGKLSIPYISSYNKEPTRNVDKTKKLKSKQTHMRTLYAEKSNENNFNNRKLGPPIIQSYDKSLQGRSKKQQNNNFENEKDSFIEMKFNNEIDLIQNNRHKDLDNHSSIFQKSDSSKGGVRKIQSKSISNKDVLEKLNPNDSQQHVTGIRKVVLSKGQNILSTQQVTAHQRKSRLVTGKSKITLTLSEIKRRLSSIKFPLVILGKDQLSSTITVENYDPPQFAGLDDHIWPFMRTWYDKSYENLFDSNNKVKANYSYENLNPNTGLKNIKDHTTNQKIHSYPKVENHISKDKYDTLPIKDDKFKNITAHVKPMRRIKNSMMQFMLKNTAPENKSNNSKCKQKENIKLVDVGTGNHLILMKQNALLKKDVNVPKKSSFFNIHAKTKGKWASEFIENVIRKIKNGVYYYQDDNDEIKKQRYNTKEDGLQTETGKVKSQPDFDDIKDEESFVANDIDSDVLIPGFDNQLSDLEFETLNNFNKVAVKNRVANIIIQFDVALSLESNCALQMKQSYPCIPISLVKNKPTIFKCKTTIINAVLPSELCSILPKLMKNMIHSNSKWALPTRVVDKSNSNLSTISELNRLEIYSNKYVIPVHIDPTLKIKVAGEGHFLSPIISNKIKRSYNKLGSQLSFDFINIKGLLISININLQSFRHMELINFLKYDKEPNHKQCKYNEIIQPPKNIPTCKALHPYQYSAKKIMLSHENYSFMRIVENILKSENSIFNLTTAFNNNLKIVFYKSSLNISFVISGIRQHSSDFPNVKIDDLQNEPNYHPVSVKMLDTSHLNTYNAPKAITSNMNLMRTSKSEKRKSAVEFCKSNIKNKKRCFVKLYQKCKSMSSISTNRSSMNLDKITDLEEFCLALGFGKVLSGVLDGNAERKILFSIREMKNWITDITPRQALLVLLLANKKDTTNLVRYRPIILQGIAVNRITRASELDMEIEVIERENLNKLAQFEGITYLPASEENQDTLLEELCWIAKTTASDYQKPFDESSERLLKSLLEKRKKLNPSYLRVMARYVGLGLLKTSK